MNPRRLLPESARWVFARRHVRLAELAEQRADAALAIGNESLEALHGREALREYLRAVRWVPLKHARQLPSPEDIGSHPVDEQLWPDEVSDVDARRTIPCIICGTRIPRALVNDTDPDSGKFCARCR